MQQSELLPGRAQRRGTCTPAMANRCYLYACEADPSSHDVTPIGLCEHTGEIALAQLLMLTRGARAIDSLLFDDHYAVVAELVGAADRALAFLAKLGEGEVADRAAFEDAVAQMRDVLAQTSLDSHVLLEVGELRDRDDVKELITTLRDLDQR